MNRSVLSALILSLLLVSGCELSSAKVAFVDTARVFKESTHGESAAIFLANQKTKLQNDLTQIQQELAKDPNNKEMQQYVVTMHRYFQQRMNTEQQNVVNILNKKLLAVVEKYRQDNKLSHVVSTQGVVAYDKESEVTKQIITALNAEKIQFSPVTQNAPVPARPKASSKAPAKAPEQPAETKEDPKKKTN